jgi:hypothetical protein
MVILQLSTQNSRQFGIMQGLKPMHLLLVLCSMRLECYGLNVVPPSQIPDMMVSEKGLGKVVRP